MSPVIFPTGMRLERLSRAHPRKRFRCGQEDVDNWLATKALQNQEKRLSVSKVLLDGDGEIAGYYTLATAQLDFSDLPAEAAKGLPKRLLPVAVLAWLGVAAHLKGQGLGKKLLAKALRDCYEAGQTFAFIAVILDCLNDDAKAFYGRFHFRELPGHPYRLFITAREVEAMMAATA